MLAENQNIGARHRVCVSSARKNVHSRRVATTSDRKSAKSPASKNELGGGTITHFATRPILEGEIIQNVIAEMTAKQDSDKVAEVGDKEQAVNKEPETSTRPSAKEIKEREIQKEIQRVSRSVNLNAGKMHRWARRRQRIGFSFSKLFLALACTVLAVAGIVYLVDINSPDIAMKVAAMQTGINAVYPSYTPRGYALSDITSESGRVTLNFKNAETGGTYSLIEDNIEASSGNVLMEYIQEAFGSDYNKIDERGISVYINNGEAAWINGGIMYKLKSTSGTLTRKQIVAIATSK